MNDFESRLSGMLDDVAAGVHPRTDPDAVLAPTVRATSERTVPHRFRPGVAAAAAAMLVLVGGSALAMERMAGDQPSRLNVSPPVATGDSTTSTEPAEDPEREPEPGTTVAVVATVDHQTRPRATAAEPQPTGPPTSEPTTTTTAEPEPSQPPAVEFTAKLGAAGLGKTPMQQGFYGTAQPGAEVRVGSDFGVVEVIASSKGKWEALLKMYEVPAGTKVGVRVTASGTTEVYEFSLKRPAAEPPVVEFTASLGTAGLDQTPMCQDFYGTAVPGSAIRVATDYGVAETTADSAGHWAATLKMYEVPAGANVGVRITSSTSTKVREFSLKRPGEPAHVAFTAHAAQSESDHSPTVNEYWGTAKAGSVVTIASEYGGKQVTANASGEWSARVEFPEVPLGVTFDVHVTNNKSEASFHFALTHVAA